MYSNGEVKEGSILCDSCGTRYTVLNYVPRFVPADAYVGSFTFQWKNFPRIQYGSETERSFSRFNLKLEELSDKRILDAGCGSGRFVDFFSKHAAEVVGIDLSYSVDEALRHCGLRQNVHILQADLLRLPLKEEIFDLVFSFGVLMHSPSTKNAFMQITRFVKPRGRLAVFVYAKWSEKGAWGSRAKERLSDSYRKITSRLPFGVLHKLSYIAIPLYEMKKVPKLGKLVDIAIESSMNPDWRLRVLETFDWYSPKYQWKHTRGEVVSWFKEAGFNEIFVSSHPVSVVGSKTQQNISSQASAAERIWNGIT
jgi:SAM-dependent methyltransferase